MAHSLQSPTQQTPAHHRVLPNVAPREAIFPAQFNNISTGGLFTEDHRTSQNNLRQEFPSHSSQVPMYSSGTRSLPMPPAHDVQLSPSSEFAEPDDDNRRAAVNRKRTTTREFHRPYLKEMAAPHAENRDAVIHIPVSNSGTIIGLKGPWHRAARLCARQTLNFRVRSYKAKREIWSSQVACIAEKLSHQFTYSQPLDIKYLGKFLKNTLKNDRKCWKKYFIANGGARHPRCPMEAFTEWRKYWMSAEGKDESV